MSTDILTHYANEVARKLAAEQDALIRRCISARIGDNWTDEAIMPRLRWEQERGKPEKVLMLDDEPLLMIWPPESRTEWDDANLCSRLKWSVNYLEMP
jgi:hypothetical protein